MTKDVENFLEKNNVNNIDFSQVDTTLYDTEDINFIVASDGMYDSSIYTSISIANVYGYEYKWRNITNDIFKSLDSFFDSNGDSYHSRSVGVLDYSKDEIIEKLSKSFKEEPICVQEVDQGKYVVSINGLHRYSVLRTYYLIEKAQAGDNQEKLDALEEKYTIPVRASKLSYIKTYSKFLLRLFGISSNMSSEYDKNFVNTGRVEITTKDRKKYILNDEQLIEFLNLSIDINIVNDYIDYIERICNRYPSFKQYISSYVSCIDSLININNKENKQ